MSFTYRIKRMCFLKSKKTNIQASIRVKAGSTDSSINFRLDYSLTNITD